MSLKYYPLAGIEQNKYTRGNQFILPDGTPYTGRYYLTYDGKAFTGINPVLGRNELLVPVTQPKLKESSVLVPGTPLPAGQSEEIIGPYARARVQSGFGENSIQLTELKPYFPTPSDSDYARGYFTRYFAKTVSGAGSVFEISKTDWTMIQNGDILAENILGYESIDMLWQLTGPLNDTRVSQYQVKGGVFDTNKRVTETKNKVFNGLLEYIGGEYTKLARITP
jgi:hypothetical protein